MWRSKFCWLVEISGSSGIGRAFFMLDFLGNTT
nr:MAG TPA: ENOD40 protein [Caudoviricetes sp.]